MLSSEVLSVQPCKDELSQLREGVRDSLATRIGKRTVARAAAL
jgi:hypothetical protein